MYKIFFTCKIRTLGDLLISSFVHFSSFLYFDVPAISIRRFGQSKCDRVIDLNQNNIPQMLTLCKQDRKQARLISLATSFCGDAIRAALSMIELRKPRCLTLPMLGVLASKAQG